MIYLSPAGDQLLLPDDGQPAHHRRGAEGEHRPLHESLVQAQLRDREVDRQRRHQGRHLRAGRHPRRHGAHIQLPGTRFNAFVEASDICNVQFVYRVAQNHGKQVLRISPIKFHFPIIQFVVIPHGQRDLSSLPWTGEAAVQIS